MLHFKIAYPGHRNDARLWKKFFLFQIYVEKYLGFMCIQSQQKQHQKQQNQNQ